MEVSKETLKVGKVLLFLFGRPYVISDRRLRLEGGELFVFRTIPDHCWGARQ